MATVIDGWVTSDGWRCCRYCGVEPEVGAQMYRTIVPKDVEVLSHLSCGDCYALRWDVFTDMGLPGHAESTPDDYLAWAKVNEYDSPRAFAYLARREESGCDEPGPF